MIQKDYIMRMIEQLGKAIAKAMVKEKEGNQEGAIKEIEHSFVNLIGVDSLLLEKLSYADISELLGISKDKPTGSMKCIAAAKLLKEKARLLKDTQPEKSLKNLHKALCLYIQGILNSGYTDVDMTGYFSDVMAIEKDLKGKMSAEETALLFEFHKKAKEFG
jgi:hypothetical protein